MRLVIAQNDCQPRFSASAWAVEPPPGAPARLGARPGELYASLLRPGLPEQHLRTQAVSGIAMLLPLHAHVLPSPDMPLPSD